MVRNERPRDSSFEALRRHFEAHQQGHVFRFWGRLDAAGRERLIHEREEFNRMVSAIQKVLKMAEGV